MLVSGDARATDVSVTQKQFGVLLLVKMKCIYLNVLLCTEQYDYITLT